MSAKSSRPYITQAMRREVAQRYGCPDGETRWVGCAYCGAPILISRLERRRVRFLDAEGRPWPELDHVNPLYWGGAHVTENIVVACLSCNRSKGPRRLAGAL